MPRGLNYYAEGEIVFIFGAEGERTGNGMWAENTGSYGRTVEHDPEEIALEETTLGVVHSKLERMLSTDKGDLIAQVRIGRREAVHLFLEKILRPEHFTKAYEEGGCIILPQVFIPYSKIGGLWFIVKICISKEKRGIVLLDSKGRILKSSHNAKAEADKLLASFEPDASGTPPDLFAIEGEEEDTDIEVGLEKIAAA